MNWVGVQYSGEKFCREFVARYLADKGVSMPSVDTPSAAKDWYRVEIPQENDVVVFNIAGKPAHVGVCLGRGDFLHVEEGSKSCVERLSSPMWSRRIEGYYRHTGVVR